MKGFVLFAFRESDEILTLMAFPVLKIQLHFFFAYDVSSGHSERLVGFFEVVPSVGFLPYGLFSSLFKCGNFLYEVYILIHWCIGRRI